MNLYLVAENGRIQLIKFPSHEHFWGIKEMHEIQMFADHIFSDSITPHHTDSTSSLPDSAQRYCIRVDAHVFNEILLHLLPHDILCLVLMTSKIDTGHE